jgi:uncharacterized membrane protein
LKKQIFGISQLKRILWRGLIITLPIMIIGWIIYSVLNTINKIGDKVLNPFISKDHIIWGMGLLVILILIFIIGSIEVFYGGKEKNIWKTIKTKTIGRIPLFGPFFLSTEKSVISLDELSKLTPCKFWLSDTTPHYGFIIREQKVRGAETEIDVYRPNVPTIIPGDLFPLKKRLVIKLGNPSGEILDKLASGGFIGSEEEIPVPWEDETEEEFKERINLTPLEIAVKRLMEGKFGNLS